MTTPLQQLLDIRVADGRVAGAVALLAGPDGEEVAVCGHHDLERTTTMARDSLFRLSSASKPLTAALVMTLVDDGTLALDDPVAPWLPELAAPWVVRTPESAVDDVVPAARPITVEDLLTMRAGWGYAPDFDLPAVALLAERIERAGDAHDPRPPDAWLADLATVPLLAQPGERWLYNTCSDLQGALVARVLGQDLPTALAERVTGPLGLTDTGFVVPAGQEHRLVDFHQWRDGALRPVAEEPGVWTRPPAFPSGSGGLIGTLDDLARFLRMVAGGGELDGVRVLSEASVGAMTTDRLTAEQRADGGFFLDGRGWGYGGSVDVASDDPSVVPGRYGWVGGSGTAAYVVPSTGQLTICLTQRALGAPDDFALLAEVLLLR